MKQVNKKATYKTNTAYKTVQSPKVKKESFFDIAWNWLAARNFKMVFWGSIVVIAMLLTYMSSKTSFVGDGVIDYNYGKKCLDYYLSGGKDTSCLNLKVEDYSFPLQKNYGCGFEGTFAALDQIFHFDDIFSARIYYLVIWNILLVISIGLIAMNLSGWKAASLAIWLTFLTPFLLGQFLWNTKDIPHALGFSVAIFFMLRFFKKLPDISWKNLLGISLGIATALSIRIGGVLIVFYFALFSLIACFALPKVRNLFTSKNYIQIAKITGAIIIGTVLGVVGGMLFYPNFFEIGFKQITEAIHVATTFPPRIPFVYEGKMIDSLHLPEYFLIKMFYITTPLAILIMLHLAFLVMLGRCKKIGVFNVIVLIFTFIFPFIYMTVTKANVYDGWRHILFAYVTVPVMIAVSYKELLIIWRSSILKWISLLIITASLAYLLVWNVKNAPFQLVYYNSTVGGTHKAFKKYDFNQSQIGGARGVDWVLKTVSPDKYSTAKPLVVAMNNSFVCKNYHIPKQWQGKVIIKDISFGSYSSVECDYAVLILLFASPQQLSAFYPPVGVVYKEEVDGIPMFCVMDRRNDTDYRGIKLLQENKFDEGMKYIEQAYEYNPNNYTLYFWMGYGYFRTGKYESAIEFLNAYKNFYWNDMNTNRFLGFAYYSTRQYDNALEAFNIAFSQDQSDLSMAYTIAQCLYEKKDYTQALQFVQQIVNANPSFEEGKILLKQIQAAIGR